jgi:uncharacterized membrane protein
MNQTVTGARGRGISAQRWGGIIAGSALAALGISRRSKAGAVLAATGGLVALASARVGTGPRELMARSSTQINCSPQEAFQFWRNFENLPSFMRHLETVTAEDGGRRSRWIALGPLGRRITWDAEIVAERENELISWRSLPGSDINVDGFVEFSHAPGNRGTTVSATILYEPPAGRIGYTVAKLLGKDPSFLMRQDLRRLKALIETGEVPTTEGQSHGPRSATAALARTINPDQPLRKEAAMREVLAAKRRIS